MLRSPLRIFLPLLFGFVTMAAAPQAARPVRGNNQGWTRTRVRSPAAGSRRTTLMLTPRSRSGSRSAFRPRTPRACGTLENQRFSRNSYDNVLF
jgi:hypothetical protein